MEKTAVQKSFFLFLIFVTFYWHHVHLFTEERSPHPSVGLWGEGKSSVTQATVQGHPRAGRTARAPHQRDVHWGGGSLGGGKGAGEKFLLA